MTSPYCPERGDVVWLDFDPTRGREQQKRRPALVLSRRIYNQKAGLCVACPITSKVKGYPFEVALAGAKEAKGVVLADQLRTMAWPARNCTFIERCSPAVLQAVHDKLKPLLF